jgi:histidinol-phosphate/aromatic aminotransferase/cobyric acid decarboxylase-like protein
MERLAHPWPDGLSSVTNFLLLKITQPGWDAPRLQQGLIRHGLLIRDCRSFPAWRGFMRIAVRGRKTIADS